ncbi:MAG: NADH:ubiquinone reductase (Na(+)-transporting) subunit A, partial [Chlamydiae bacterium]|nr:NADH:ubiquinone reductase (Na(+)-transporting) subunit A [Chlamydiota bacterium]
MKIRIKRGLDLPFPKSKPVQTTLSKPKRLALNLDPFDAIRFKLHVKVGDHVKLGEPIAENKAIAGQMFLSPASGTVVELKRGLKRRLLDVVIEVDEKEELYQHEPPKEGKEELLEFFLRAGVFPHIRLRPFDLVADPTHLPRAIFVRAVESRPLSQEIVVEQENERYFAKGLEALGQIAAVHLVYREKSSCPAFVKAEGVEKHTVMGPHPAGNSSVHIHHILPIKSAHDYTWTIDTVGVVTIGKLLLDHTYFVDRTIQLEGPGVSQSAIFKARMGYPIADL